CLKIESGSVPPSGPLVERERSPLLSRSPSRPISNSPSCSVRLISLPSSRVAYAFYPWNLHLMIKEGCLSRLCILAASSQTAPPIRQREEPFVSEISSSNHPLSLSFRHASLTSYAFIFIARRRPQLHPPVPGITWP